MHLAAVQGVDLRLVFVAELELPLADRVALGQDIAKPCHKSPLIYHKYIYSAIVLPPDGNFKCLPRPSPE